MIILLTGLLPSIIIPSSYFELEMSSVESDVIWRKDIPGASKIMAVGFKNRIEYSGYDIS
jgi:hypothetical protein